MKKMLLVVTSLVLISAVSLGQSKDKKAAPADEGKGKALVQKHNCVACHASKGVVAPEFKDVLSKYTDADKFQKYLAKPVKSGKFPGAMPPVTVSKEEAKQMLTYLQDDLKKSAKPAKK
ncbi:MAG: cytochrome c [Bacteroidetes bacterium]|nr:cytochrome c [Bacteroidota bacterium]